MFTHQTARLRCRRWIEGDAKGGGVITKVIWFLCSLAEKYIFRMEASTNYSAYIMHSVNDQIVGSIETFHRFRSLKDVSRSGKYRQFLDQGPLFEKRI